MLDEKLTPSCIKSISSEKGGKSGSEREKNTPRFHGQKVMLITNILMLVCF